MRYLRIIGALMLAGMLTFDAALAANGAAAAVAVQQARSEEPAPPSPTDVAELARLLGDERVRHWLLSRAAEVASESDGPLGGRSVQEWLKDNLTRFERRFVSIAAAWEGHEKAAMDFARSWGEQTDEGGTLRSLVYVLIFLLVGAGAEWLYWRYAGGARLRVERAAAEGRSVGIRPLLGRAALDVFGIGLFAVGTIGAFLWFDWPEKVALLVLTLLLAVVLVRVVNTVLVIFLCPRVPALRPLELSTTDARQLHRALLALAAIGIPGFMAAAVIGETGMASALALLVATGTATALALGTLALVWVAGRSRQARGRRSLRPDLLPVVGTVVVVVAWILWMGGAEAMFWTVAVVAIAPWAERWAQALVGACLVRASAETDGETTGGEAGEDDAAGSSYRPVLERLVRFVVLVGAVLAVSIAWDVAPWSMSAASGPAGWLVDAVVDVLVVVLIADLVWVWARTAIDARLADYVPPEDGHAPGPEARLATLLPLLRNTLFITLVVMVVLIALSSFGVNVGPLLAGAGVVGIAIGFGAQALVRDIVSGVFFLLDDAFRVGEYIEVGDLRGTVESVSVRSLRLRHHRGAVHTIPFGEMKSLTNHSRDWVIMKLEFRVPFETDLRLVKKLIKQIGQELADDEEIGPSFIEPLKSQGVRRMEEFNMVVGVKFKARPGEQWSIRKETYQRVRDAFDRHGLNFAERNVKVEVIGADPSDPAVERAVAGAAQSALEQLPPPGAAPASNRG